MCNMKAQSNGSLKSNSFLHDYVQDFDGEGKKLNSSIVINPEFVLCGIGSRFSRQ